MATIPCLRANVDTEILGALIAVDLGLILWQLSSSTSDFPFLLCSATMSLVFLLEVGWKSTLLGFGLADIKDHINQISHGQWHSRKKSVNITARRFKTDFFAKDMTVTLFSTAGFICELMAIQLPTHMRVQCDNGSTSACTDWEVFGAQGAGPTLMRFAIMLRLLRLMRLPGLWIVRSKSIRASLSESNLGSSLKKLERLKSFLRNLENQEHARHVNDLMWAMHAMSSKRLYDATYNVAFDSVEIQKFVEQQVGRINPERLNPRRSSEWMVGGSKGAKGDDIPGNVSTELLDKVCDMCSDDHGRGGRKVKSQVDRKKVETVLNKASSWNFDVFEADEASGLVPLAMMGYYTFHTLGLVENFDIPDDTLRAFLARVEAEYNVVPFHNSLHAANVLHSLVHLLVANKLVSIFRPTELMAAVISALVCDMGHTGVNNHFLVKTKHEFALTYHDHSCLEHYHASRCFQILQEDGFNILKNVPPTKYKEIRKGIIGLVLSTDLRRAMELIEGSEKLVVGAAGVNVFESEGIDILKIVLNCSVFATIAKPLDQCKRWSRLRIREYFAQGDEEKARGLEVSMHMNKEDGDMAMILLHSALIQVFAIPFFSLLDRIVFSHSGAHGMSDCLNGLHANKDYFTVKADHTPSQGGASSKDIVNNDGGSSTPDPSSMADEMRKREQNSLKRKEKLFKRGIITEEDFAKAQLEFEQGGWDQ